MDKNVLSESRKELVSKLGIKDKVFEDFTYRYSKGRFYHNLEHISDLLMLFKKFKHLADYQLGVEMAIWGHDAIYDPEKRDNELKSAELTYKALMDNNLSQVFSKHVHDVIINANHNNTLTDKDTILLHDIDYSILGRDENTYDKYSRHIRLEYRHLEDEEFFSGRKKFLEGLLKKDIFINKEFKDLYEAPAKKNIEREIAQIDKDLKYFKH